MGQSSEDLSARLLKAAGERLKEIGMEKVAEAADVASRLFNKAGGERQGQGWEEGGRIQDSCRGQGSCSGDAQSAGCRGRRTQDRKRFDGRLDESLDGAC